MTQQRAVIDQVPPIPGETELERLVARSRMIGADPTLVVHGGGNTLSKVWEVDHLGRERTVLRIKGSGTDLASIGPDGFPGLYLDELLPLRNRPEMTDEAMVAYLARCMVEPGSRRPSIETLLHAFLPATHVDHVHADAICALTNNPEPERHVREALGPDVAVVPYVRPGFDLSRRVAALAGHRAVVLAKHGLVTWGETHEESYESTLELVARARSYVEERQSSSRLVQVAEPGVADRERLLLKLRGRLSRDGRRILTVDRAQRPLADRPDVERVATAARATPDHILRIGAASAVVRSAAEIPRIVDDFERGYRAYFARHQGRLPAGLSMLSPLPRIVLVPGLGCVAAGADAGAARVNGEIAYRSHRVTATTLDTFGEIDWLTEAEIFDFDYWPLELAKLAFAPPPKPFAGHVAVVSGASSGLGEVVADRLVGEGAHLVLVEDGAIPPSESTSASSSRTRFVVSTADPVGAAIEAFGGVDALILLSPPSPSLLTRFAQAVAHQGLDGVVVTLGGAAELAAVAGLLSSGRRIRLNAIHSPTKAPATDIAEAIAFFGSDRSRSTYGAVLSVATP